MRLLILSLSMGAGAAAASGLPTGPTVGAGAVTVTNSGTVTTIDQSSQSAILNWQGFSIGKGDRVLVNQPGVSSVLLNRVIGNAPSTIAGSLSANGQVYLINPNGIAITKTGTVKVGGGFVASTLNISDIDFLDGVTKFTGGGNSAAVSNAGVITVGRGGYAALLGGRVANTGLIAAPMGRVALGSGEATTLDFSGDGFLQVATPTAGATPGSLIQQGGTIQANGGLVVMSAATAQAAARNAVNMSGIVQANTISGKNGAIVIDGGAGGSVAVAGQLNATAAQGAGGAITVTGQAVDVSGTIDASGANGGGTVTIGGGPHGTPLPGLTTASTVSIDSAATIRADARNSGNGGTVTIWSNDATDFKGGISAQALGTHGNGGNAEVSGGSLNYLGTTNLLAAHGGTGNLLLDPYNVTIQTATGAPTFTCTPGSCTPSGSNSILTVSALQSALSSGNVTVTTGSSGTDAGNIAVNNAVTWSNGSNLTLNAANNITVASGASITATGGGGISMTAAAGGVSITSATISTNTGNLHVSAPASTTVGVSLNGATIIVGSGTGTISGTTSGTAATANGVYFSGANTLTAASGGSLSLSGTASSATATSSAYGINFASAASLASSGAVTLTGAGSPGAGVDFLGSATITDSSGNLSINANSSSTHQSAVNFSGAESFVNSGAGSVAINATQTGTQNGIYVASGQSITTSGSVSITASAASGAGFYLAGTNSITDSSGNLTIAASASTSGIGVKGTGALTFTNSGTGTLAISGISATSYGVDIVAGTTFTTTTSSTGPVNLSGSGVGANGDINIASSGAITLGTGSITGIGDGINIASSAGAISLTKTTVATGNGALAIGATTAGSSVGVTLSGDTINVGAGTGAITGISTSNSGVNLSGANTLSATSGSLSISGTSTSGIGINVATGVSLTTTGATTLTARSSTNLAVDLVGNATITDNGGNLTINASNSATTWSAINFSGAETFTNNGAGTFTLNSMPTASQNAIYFGTSASLISSGSVTLMLNAASGSGLYLRPSSSITDLSGNLTIAAASTTGIGVTGVGNVALANSGSGTLAISGTSNSNYGVEISGGTTFSAASSGTGQINLTGSGVGTNGDVNIATSGAITLGSVKISGAGGTGISVASTGGAIGLTGTTVAAGSGALRMQSGMASDITLGAGSALSSSATGTAVTLASGRNFLNNSGASAISTSAGRWLVFSASPGADTFGGLNSANTAIWDATYAGTGGAISASGSRYIFSIQPTLTFTSTNDTKTYGVVATSAVASDYTVGGYQAGVANAFVGDSAASAYSGAPAVTSVGSAATATVLGSPYAINVSAGTLSALNGYALAYASPGNLTVSPASLTITASDQSKTYGTAANLGSTAFSTTGLVNSDTVSSVTLASTGAPATANVGTYALTDSNATGSGLANYIITYAASPTGLTVNPANLTITASDQSKIYGTLANLGTSAFTTAGLVNSDSVSAVTLASAGALATASVGTYALTGSNAAGTGLSNYTITYAAAPTGLTVNPASLTITASNQSKTYGALANLGTTAFTTAGLLNSDTVSSVTLASTGAPATANVGTYALIDSNATGTGLSNYTISYAAAPTGLTVNPAALTITASDQSKTYGTVANLGTTAFSTTGLLNSDVVSGLTLASAGSPATANVGTYAMTGSDATGTGLSNYTITYAPAPTGLTVNPASLTITADNQSKTYGTPVNLGTIGFTATGLMNSDAVSGVTLASAGAPATANVGTYALTDSNATGTGLSNYTISYAAAPLGLTVNPASLVVTADNQSKTYGTSANLGTSAFTTSGLLNSDAVSAVTLASTGTPATANVGTYALTGSNASGTALSNYTITYAPAPTGFTVNPASLTITADNQSKTYGTSANLGMTAFTTTGLLNSDAVSAVTLASAGAPATASAGTYALTGSNATGTGLSNYAISYVAAPSGLTVNPANLLITVSPNSQTESKTYGTVANLGATAFTTSGLVNNDTVSSVSLASPGAPATAAVGTYAVTGSNASGTGLSNYTISYAAAPMGLTVNPASLTITADNQSKTYGAVANLGTTAFTTSGLVNNDSVSTVTLASPGAPASANVGTYTLTGGNATGTGLSNYTISYAAASTGLTVNPASLTITADNQSKLYGTSANLGTTAFTTSGLMNSDEVTAIALTSAGTSPTANVGTYALTGSNATGSGLSNYTISYAAAPTGLTVNPSSLLITIAPNGQSESKTYGTVANLGTTDFMASGLMNNDSVSAVTLASAGAPATANVGTYAVIGSNAIGSGLSNYTIGYAAAPTGLVVTPANLTVTVAPNGQSLSKTYGTAANLGTTDFTTSGLVNNDTVSTVTLASAGAPATANVGTYAVTGSNASGSGLSNYAITYTAAPSGLIVSPATLTIAADNQSKLYGTSGNLRTTAFTTSGLVNSDAVSAVTLASAGSSATANAGIYALTPSNASGIGLSNYTISYVPAPIGLTVISPLGLFSASASAVDRDAIDAFPVVGRTVLLQRAPTDDDINAISDPRFTATTFVCSPTPWLVNMPVRCSTHHAPRPGRMP